MAYFITYIKDNERHDLEWIAGNGWTKDSIRDCFERRYPQAQIISLHERPCSSLFI
jgi:hypothetical protein